MNTTPRARRTFLDRQLIFEDLLFVAKRRRNSPLPLFKVQLHLLEELVYAQRVLAECKKDKDALPSIADADSDAKREAIEYEIALRETDWHTVRDIGDGIAWRLFDYDRPTLYELADRSDVTIVHQEGLFSELLALGHAVETKAVLGILNVVTHILKHGDVTLRLSDTDYEIQEIKASNAGGGRITRQRQALHNSIQFLNTGVRDKASHQLIIRELPVTPTTFTDRVDTLIKDAERRGLAWMQIDDDVVALCVDVAAVREQPPEETMPIFDAALATAASWVAAGDFVSDFDSRLKYINVRNYAPYSIYPLSDLTRIRLMTGALIVQVQVNISGILRRCAPSGWRVEMGPKDCIAAGKAQGLLDFPTAVLRNGRHHVSMPPLWFGRIGWEFLAADIIPTIVSSLADETREGATEVAIKLRDEALLWD